MSKEMTVIALGLWITIVPYLGIPSSWRTIVIVLSGVSIATVGLILRAEVMSRGVRRTNRHPFVENAIASIVDNSNNERKEGITSLN